MKGRANPGRAATSLLVALLALASSPAVAQSQTEEEDDITFEEDDLSKETTPQPEPEPAPDVEIEPDPEPRVGPEADAEGPVAGLPEPVLGDERESWRDIVVVVRKPFLKVRRLELVPQWGITMNDNLIHHIQFNGQANYFLTDVLAVGAEAHLFFDDKRPAFDEVGLQARRTVRVNQYKYGAALLFHYVPIYGKFAVLDQYILHWESAFTTGVGVTQTEVLPQNPPQQPFSNVLVTGNVGANMRFFLTKFITVNLGIRDYVFIDQYEANNRTEISGAVAKQNARPALVNHVVFQAGVSFWFPPTFEYTTFR